MKHLTLACLLVLPALAGCLSFFTDPEPTIGGELGDFDFAVPDDLSGPVSADRVTWPDFREAAGGQAPVLRILDHGAFPAFDDAAERFEQLTGAKVEHEEADDTGNAIRTAIDNRASPEHDIIYGIDNVYLGHAMDEGILEAYTPMLAPRIAEDLVFFADGGEDVEVWPATPVDHGWIAINIDAGHPDMNGTVITDLHDVARNAHLFVTQDPHTSSPGMGFFMITVGRFGDAGATTWQQYWTSLFIGPDGRNGTGDEVLVTSDWSTAYEIHFSGGYGQFMEGHLGDKPMVTSYTESPAYEAYYGATEVADVLLDERGSAFHQIQTMAILNGTKNRAIAQAWIEFTLTKDFQELAAPANAVYPVDPDVPTDEVYGGLDPEPGSFDEVFVDWRIGIAPDGSDTSRLERLLDDWQDLCERYSCR